MRYSHVALDDVLLEEVLIPTRTAEEIGLGATLRLPHIDSLSLAINALAVWAEDAHV